MAETTFEAIVESLDRLRNTGNGNPRYRVHLQGGDTLLTEQDAQVAYLIPNERYHGAPVRLTLNDRGFIIRVEEI